MATIIQITPRHLKKKYDEYHEGKKLSNWLPLFQETYPWKSLLSTAIVLTIIILNYPYITPGRHKKKRPSVKVIIHEPK